MGTAAWLGASATSYALTLTGAFKVYLYGITLRIGGSTSKNLAINGAENGHFELEDCYIWQGSTNTGPRINSGNASGNTNTYTLLKNCTLRWGNVSQTGLAPSGRFEMIGGSVSSAGSAPQTFIAAAANMQGTDFVGVDLSHVTATLVASQTNSAAKVNFAQCKLGAGVTVMATQTPANKASAQVWVHDCSDGDTHGLFGYYDAFGSLTSDTGIYVTAGAAAQSWQIDTTANCSFGTPFVTPWVSLYNTGTAAITPRLEILRDGSTTAYTDVEVWGEFSVKDNAGFTHSTVYNDRQALVDWAAGTAGANQATGAGTGTWTGGTTPWSGKVDSGAAVTPDEAGHIRGRIVVGAPSITVYADPQIRT